MKEKKLRKAIDYAKETSNVFTDRYGTRMSRSLHITGAAATVGAFVAMGKLAMGIVFMSLFMCVNAMYSFGMIGARSIALTGARKAQNREKQYFYYFWSGVVLAGSSLLYIGYSVQLFFHPISNSYHEYAAIGIAAVTFTEIGLNIRGVVITRHNHTLLIHAVKMINLSASLISLVLTQTAILSFTEKEAEHFNSSRANGVIGVLMGTVAALIGSYMIYRVGKLKRTEGRIESQNKGEKNDSYFSGGR